MAYVLHGTVNGFLAATMTLEAFPAPALDPAFFREILTAPAGFVRQRVQVDIPAADIPAGATLLCCQVATSAGVFLGAGYCPAEAGFQSFGFSLPSVTEATDRLVMLRWTREPGAEGPLCAPLTRTQAITYPPDPAGLHATTLPLLRLDATTPGEVGTVADVIVPQVAGGVAPYEVNAYLVSADDADGTNDAIDGHVPGENIDAGLVGKHLAAEAEITDSDGPPTTILVRGPFTEFPVFEAGPLTITVISHSFVEVDTDEYLPIIEIGGIDAGDYAGYAGSGLQVQWARLPANPSATPSYEIMSPIAYVEGLEAVQAGQAQDWRCNRIANQTGKWEESNRRKPVHRPPDTYAFLIRARESDSDDWSEPVLLDPAVTAPNFPWLEVTGTIGRHHRSLDVNAGAAATDPDWYGDGHQYDRGIAVADDSTVFGGGDMNGIVKSLQFGGDFFTPVCAGLTAYGFNSVAVDPDDSSRACFDGHAAWLDSWTTPPFSGTSGLFFTPDGGDAFSRAYIRPANVNGPRRGAGNEYHQRLIVLDPTTRDEAPANRRWLFLDHDFRNVGGNRPAEGRARLMVSNDGLESFAPAPGSVEIAGTKFGSCFWLEPHPTTPNKLYLGSALGLFQSAGTSLPLTAADWVRVGTGLPAVHCRSVYVSPSGATIIVSIYNGTAAQNGVWLWNGSTWTRKLAQEVRDLAVNWNGTVTIVARVPAGTESLADVYVSTDLGDNWTTNKPRETIPGDPNDELCVRGSYDGIRAHPTIAGSFLIHSDSRWFKSVDYGETWSARDASRGFTGINCAMQPAFVQVHPTVPSRFDIFVEDLGQISFNAYAAAGFTRSTINRTTQNHGGFSRLSASAGTILRSGRAVMAIGATQQLLYYRNPGANVWVEAQYTGAGITSPQVESEDWRTALRFVGRVVEHPTANNVVWAGTFKSTDGGANYTLQTRSIVDVWPDGTGLFVSGNNVLSTSSNWNAASPTFTPFWTAPDTLRPLDRYYTVARCNPFRARQVYTRAAGHDLVVVTNDGVTDAAASLAHHPLRPQTGLAANLFEISSIGVDRQLEGHIAVTLDWAGVPNLYEGQLTAGAMSWTDSTFNLPSTPLNTCDFHPATSDLITGGPRGFWCLPPLIARSTSIYDNCPEVVPALLRGLPIEAGLPTGLLLSLIMES